MCYGRTGRHLTVCFILFYLIYALYHPTHPSFRTHVRLHSLVFGSCNIFMSTVSEHLKTHDVDLWAVIPIVMWQDIKVSEGILKSLHPEDSGSLFLRNVGMLPHPYTASQPRRPRDEFSSLWKFSSPSLLDKSCPSRKKNICGRPVARGK